MDELVFVTIWQVEVDLLQQSDLGKHGECSGNIDKVVSKRESSEREARGQVMRVFGIQVVHNAVGIFGSRTEFESHLGYRMV